MKGLTYKAMWLETKFEKYDETNLRATEEMHATYSPAAVQVRFAQRMSRD